MKRAYCLLRADPVYRAQAFHAGLAAAGFHVSAEMPRVINRGDVLCIWNRYLDRHELATRFEAEGGIVLVAENGYLTPGGGSPHHRPVRDWFALAPSYHNDDTVVADGDGSRWEALGVAVKSWEPDGDHIVICPNRVFGTPGRIMPIGWAEDCARRLKKFTSREIRIRPHPGNNAPEKPIAEDLADAWACVIWSSSAGVHSLIHGVPVICEAPFWIAKSVSGTIEQIEAPPTPDRLPAFHRLARAQFSLEEIQSGKAFRDHLLRRDLEEEIRAAD